MEGNLLGGPSPTAHASATSQRCCACRAPVDDTVECPWIRRCCISRSPVRLFSDSAQEDLKRFPGPRGRRPGAVRSGHPAATLDPAPRRVSGARRRLCCHRARLPPSRGPEATSRGPGACSAGAPANLWPVRRSHRGTGDPSEMHNPQLQGEACAGSPTREVRPGSGPATGCCRPVLPTGARRTGSAPSAAESGERASGPPCHAVPWGARLPAEARPIGPGVRPSESAAGESSGSPHAHPTGTWYRSGGTQGSDHRESV